MKAKQRAAPREAYALSPGEVRRLVRAGPKGKVIWSVSWDGGPGYRVWVKRADFRVAWGSQLSAWFTYLIGRCLGAGLTRSTPVARGEEPLEAARMRHFRERGLSAPRVLGATRLAFVMEDAGEELRDAIERQPTGEARAALLEAAFEDLLRLHDAGEWHGGAQLRNLAWRDGKILRFDFEAPHGGRLPLALLQVMDLYMHVSSAVRYASDGERRRMAVRWLERMANAEILIAFRRVLRAVLWLRGFWLVRLSSYEHRRVSGAADSMEAAYSRAVARGLVQPMVRTAIPIRWHAALALVATLLVADDLYEFAIDHDDPHDLDAVIEAIDGETEKLPLEI